MPVKIKTIVALFLLCLVVSCDSSTQDDSIVEVRNVEKKAVVDHHSFSNFNEVRTTQLHLDLSVDFETRKLVGSAEHTIDNKQQADSIIFDTKDLKITKVLLNNSDEVEFRMSDEQELLGQALYVPIDLSTESVTVFYETSPESEALMWLNPQQTSGKKKPFLFTQGEAILTRSWIPCQDSPGNRITYSADIKCDSNLLAVMSAVNPQERNEKGTYYFEMDKAIPTYLIALGVGDIEFRALGERTGVYAEPDYIEKSANEFRDVEKMILAAEELYGPYEWGRYDILVMPPSFPFGGMENPKLTFATPTIIAGDRSLVSLIAHELAHSWSGNLVTNATWNDFWLNEGFTVYFENRIMEALYGKERANMLMSIEHQELLAENASILAGAHPEDTRLKLDLQGRNPDDGMTTIAYVKGALMLQSIEEKVGREKFDEFLKRYFTEHQFQTLTTEAFISYLDYFLLEPNKVDFNVSEWVYEKGIPENAIAINSNQFEEIEEFVNGFEEDVNVIDLKLDSLDWTTQEWMHFIRLLPDTGQVRFMTEIDVVHNLKGCGNAEIMAEWYVKSIKNGYKGVRYEMAEFLIEVGRRKFLEPIYEALSKNEDDKNFALKVYEKARANYHSISFNTIDEILGL